jgi:hypothetical protein
VSQRDPTFGLGEVAEVAEVVARWPSGQIDRVSGVDVDQTLTIVEGSSS